MVQESLKPNCFCKQEVQHLLSILAYETPKVACSGQHFRWDMHWNSVHAAAASSSARHSRPRRRSEELLNVPPSGLFRRCWLRGSGRLSPSSCIPP